MKLMPSLRQKKRYIVFEILSEQKFTAVEVEKVVMDTIKELIGTLGIANAAPMFLKERFQNNKFILKVNHKYVNEAKAAVALVKSIKSEPLIIRSLLTTGTIKRANDKITE